MRVDTGTNTPARSLPLGLLAITLLFTVRLEAGRYTFTVRGDKTYLNGRNILVKGLRCSNALISDESTAELIDNLDTFASYGINTVGVYFMGSRFGDVKGYNEDGSLNPIYTARMGRIIEAADDRGMIILVGCLYWSNSRAKWESWTQAQADAAIANTVRWLKEHDYRNVFVDVDNEGMAKRAKGFDNRLMVVAGKQVDPDCVIATNFKGQPPPEADLAIHHSDKVPDKPYIDSEGTPTNAPGGYWGSYSKRDGYYNYINIGIYNEEMKAKQKAITAEHLGNGRGYMCASTWLQCVPPYGPNNTPGGDGSKQSPGIRWWLEYVRDTYGPYAPAITRGRTRRDRRPTIEPTMADVKYGPHERNVLDFYRAESEEPTPLALYIHGGGFKGGSKKSLNRTALKELLAAGISVAAIEYRLVSDKPLPAAHHDSLRAIQFIRSRADQWNIDKRRFGAFGSSAGAQLCMWLGFHDEMADPQSSDPLKRESSRLSCVVTNGGQVTRDLDLWVKWIPGYDEPHLTRAEMFGDVTDEELRKIIKDISAVSLISADDPPIFMSYRMSPDDPIPTDPLRAQGWKVHHVIFGVKLKDKTDRLGVEAILKYPDAQTEYESGTSFLIAKLKPGG